jgi:hypothetical protein
MTRSNLTAPDASFAIASSDELYVAICSDVECSFSNRLIRAGLM